MNDTDVDARLTENARRWQEHRPAGPALANVLADMDVSDTGSTPLRRSGRNRRGIRPGRQLVALAAVAVVVAAVVLVGVIVRSQRGSTANPNGLPTAHPGDVSYHGITLTVPPSWPAAPGGCFTPTVDSVVVDTGEVSSCPSMQPKRAGTNTLVDLAPRTDVDDDVARIAMSRTTIDGVAALRGRGTDGRGTSTIRAVTVLMVPSLSVVIEIAAVNPAVADSVLQTVRITPIDRYGCQGRVASLTPTGNAKTAALVPGGPTSGHICEYASPRLPESINRYPYTWLVGSARLSSTQLAALIKGLSRFRPRGAPSSAELAALPSPAVWFVLRYPDMSTRTIVVSLNEDPVLAYDGYQTYSASFDGGLPSPFDR